MGCRPDRPLEEDADPGRRCGRGITVASNVEAEAKVEEREDREGEDGDEERVALPQQLHRGARLSNGDTRGRLFSSWPCRRSAEFFHKGE